MRRILVENARRKKAAKHGGDLARLDLEQIDVATPYKLLEQIGEGGMGVVWMAEQTEPVRGKVALKLIKPGMDSGRCWPGSRPSGRRWP
jgi:serine/threonine protein kinase